MTTEKRKGLDIATLLADEVPQEDGVWITYDEDTGAAMRIAYVGNKAYENKLNKLLMKARRRHKVGRDLPASVMLKARCQAMVGTILKDWKNFGENDQPYEYSEANAERMLMCSLVMRMFVEEEAADITNFQKKEDDPSGAGKSADGGAAVVS